MIDGITPQELDRRGFVATTAESMLFHHPLVRGCFVLEDGKQILWRNGWWEVAKFETLSELDGVMSSVLGDAYKVAEGEPA